MSEPEKILVLSNRVADVAHQKITRISEITSSVRMLALNAMIEAARSGEAGRGFAVVANEVKQVSAAISQVAEELTVDLKGTIAELQELGERMIAEIRGERLSNLALGMIDVIDRNLYERSCDVRWWATDAAVVGALEAGTAEAHLFASRRLGVILDSYTVYLDIWIADARGRIVANGRPGRFQVQGRDLSQSAWFRKAMETRSGADYAALDVGREAELQGHRAPVYATAVREGGAEAGRVIGAIAIFFDWDTQSAGVVNGVRLNRDEQGRTRCLLLNSAFEIIASSDAGEVGRTFRLETRGEPIGSYSQADGTVVGFALTPGYETYRGLGWYGALVQAPSR